jgi:hypothetical protein
MRCAIAPGFAFIETSLAPAEARKPASIERVRAPPLKSATTRAGRFASSAKKASCAAGSALPETTSRENAA